MDGLFSRIRTQWAFLRTNHDRKASPEDESSSDRGFMTKKDNNGRNEQVRQAGGQQGGVSIDAPVPVLQSPGRVDHAIIPKPNSVVFALSKILSPLISQPEMYETLVENPEDRHWVRTKAIVPNVIGNVLAPRLGSGPRTEVSSRDLVSAVCLPDDVQARLMFREDIREDSSSPAADAGQADKARNSSKLSCYKEAPEFRLLSRETREWLRGRAQQDQLDEAAAVHNRKKYVPSKLILITFSSWPMYSGLVRKLRVEMSHYVQKVLSPERKYYFLAVTTNWDKNTFPRKEKEGGISYRTSLIKFRSPGHARLSQCCSG